MDTPKSRVAVGVHLAAGVAWLAGATADEMFVPDRTDRVALQDQQLGELRAMHEFEASIEELIERLYPYVVGLLDVGKSRNPPTAKSSRKRGWLEAAVMLAVHRNSSRLVRVSHDEVEKAFGVRPSQGELRQVLGDKVEGSVPPKWDSRAPAFAAAIVAVRGLGEGP